MQYVGRDAPNAAEAAVSTGAPAIAVLLWWSYRCLGRKRCWPVHRMFRSWSWAMQWNWLQKTQSAGSCRAQQDCCKNFAGLSAQWKTACTCDLCVELAWQHLSAECRPATASARPTAERIHSTKHHTNEAYLLAGRISRGHWPLTACERTSSWSAFVFWSAQHILLVWLPGQHFSNRPHPWIFPWIWSGAGVGIDA